MQLQHLYIFALAGLGAATTTCIPASNVPPTQTTICVDYSQPCGTPPTATVWYGGCHDITVTTTYTAPPCPTGGGSMPSCTSTGTICDDRFKTCGSPTPTAILTYGACHDACVTLTYSEPPCPTPTTVTSISVSDTSSSSCTLTYSVCEDHIEECGSPTPTAYLTYGGCHPACEHPTYTPPPCPTSTS
ncbi:hypothetical protein F5Y01DRAFT_113872 [Xylaria sp. FL0043]|nr:hypothetical protein F5Y01DRAFT_113872 [Xylaria sp. FL0043]